MCSKNQATNLCEASIARTSLLIILKILFQGALRYLVIHQGKGGKS